MALQWNVRSVNAEHEINGALALRTSNIDEITHIYRMPVGSCMRGTVYIRLTFLAVRIRGIIHWYAFNYIFKCWVGSYTILHSLAINLR